jgi:hypothetical protein
MPFRRLSAKPEMYFSPTKLRQNKYKHRKTLASATCFDSNVPHIFKYIFFENIRININSTTYNLSLNIKFKKWHLKWQFKDDSWAYFGQNCFYKCCKEQIVFRQLKFVFFCQKAFFKHVHAVKRIGK